MALPTSRAAWAWVAAGLLGPVAFVTSKLVSPAWVEAAFAVGFGQAVARAQGRTFGLLPFSFAELVVVGGAFTLVVALVRGVRRADRLAWARRFFPRVLAVVSVLYAVFVFAWALNYRRPPLIGAFSFEAGKPTVEEVRALAEATVAAADLARVVMPEDDVGVTTPSDALGAMMVRAQAAYARAGERWPFLAGDFGPAKPLFFSTVASYWGLGGVYSPFTGEPNINVELPRFGLPFNVCHELAHQRGVAREDEANFVAYLVARDFGDPDFVYSAALDGATYASAAFARVDPESAWTLWKTLSPAVKRDLAARKRWREEHTTFIGTIGSTMNSTYLKANGVKDGVESYGRVVDLMVAERRKRR